MPESQSTLDGGSYYEEIEAHPGTTRTFLKALADTGSVTTAVAAAGTSRTRVYELRKVDPAFAAAWAEAEDIAADRLADEARRRAMEGVPIPLVSAGKLVRDDNGQPIMVRRYSDNLLMALLKAHRLPRCGRSARFPLLLLQWPPMRLMRWPRLQRQSPRVRLRRLRRASSLGLSKLTSKPSTLKAPRRRLVTRSRRMISTRRGRET